MKLILLITSILLITLVPQQQPKQPIKVYLIGDSTISIKDTKAYPETGWGMPFVHFFDSSVTVDNRAKNGRSTHTFIEEGLWQPVADNLQAGDYVFIQFGHNDEVETKKSYTTQDQYRANLTRFVQESRKQQAIPVLLTPVARRQFDEAGKIVSTHETYAAIVREVAKSQNVPLIDLDRQSQQLLQRLGVEGSKHLYLQLAPGEHPNYPDGKDDNTHFNEYGARLMAQLVLAGIKENKLPLADKVVKK
ncbi:rhamnogalacturonan acetylesterase [Pontibacter sp. HSC-36F09]|uniref:rhamnogalacturonan acetylesterase n=1 Tax=Pontibacter sp. HSC-36F09 TaxID=2910966 RepID=UPI00209CAC4A|nr:rhamnogalacturonan acetylesterase [Pontibacter sp. HSC-36F09]MCP2043374.1 lysophospholipase L1-like esterase [Pontibacter sp. HSC-36F09]